MGMTNGFDRGVNEDPLFTEVTSMLATATFLFLHPL